MLRAAFQQRVDLCHAKIGAQYGTICDSEHPSLLMDSVKLVRKLWKPGVEKRTILYSERVYCNVMQLYAYSLKALLDGFPCSPAAGCQDFNDFTRVHINSEQCIQRLLASIRSPQSLITGFARLRVVQTGGFFRPASG